VQSTDRRSGSKYSSPSTPSSYSSAAYASAKPPSAAKAAHPAPSTTTTTVFTPAPGRTQTGTASWYGAEAGSCAHQTLPFGTIVHIRDLDNGNTAICTVEDRGPYLDNRIIDLAPDVFAKLAPTSQGVANVEIAW
jgi:rare lipoprotein A (peptidoglycan hydrolase)